MVIHQMAPHPHSRLLPHRPPGTLPALVAARLAAVLPRCRIAQAPRRLRRGAVPATLAHTRDARTAVIAGRRRAGPRGCLRRSPATDLPRPLCGPS